MKRFCTLCHTGEVGDEYHYVLICPIFLEARKQFIQKYYYSRPSVFKFLELINSENKIILVKLAKFLKIVFSIFKWFGPISFEKNIRICSEEKISLGGKVSFSWQNFPQISWL